MITDPGSSSSSCGRHRHAGMHLQKSTIFVFAKEKSDDPIATREMKFKHPESAVIAHGLKSLVREHINTLLSASMEAFRIN